MADTAAVDTKETTKTVATPEKKVLLEAEDEKKIIDEIDEDSKASENGDATKEEATSLKENGSTEEKKKKEEEKATTEEDKEPESTGNGVSTDAPAAVDACCIKRKSTVGTDAVDGKTAEVGASPEKKAKLEEKSPAAAVGEADNNGGEAEAAA